MPSSPPTQFTDVPVITANLNGKIKREQYLIKGTAQPTAIITLMFYNNANNTVLSVNNIVTNAQGKWEYWPNGLVHIPYEATKMEAAAQLPGSLQSDWSQPIIYLEDGPINDTLVKVYRIMPSNTYRAFLATITGTHANPVTTRGVAISPEPRATAAEARADLRNYLNNN